MDLEDFDEVAAPLLRGVGGGLEKKNRGREDLATFSLYNLVMTRENGGFLSGSRLLGLFVIRGEDYVDEVKSYSSRRF